jgi:hypothetical protein
MPQINSRITIYSTIYTKINSIDSANREGDMFKILFNQNIMNISNKQKAAICVAVPFFIWLSTKIGAEFAIGGPVTIFAIAKVVDAITEDGVNLGKPGKSIFSSDRPRNYNKYRRAYKNRR